ncbi:15588_t:CDS:1, partial [Dentiscutata erythropus]
MSRRYPEDCVEYNGFCLYARFERIVHDEQNTQINEFECSPNQFTQQPPFVGPNHIGSFHQHSHYGPIQQPQIMNGHVQQPLIFNGPRHSRICRPEQFTQHPCINGFDQLPQITEINNVNNENYIPAEPNPQIQHHQATIRNYQIQPPPLTPVQANIQINNLQRQPSFASQTSNSSNITIQPLQEFKNCNCLVCSFLKNQCFQSIGDENCVTRNEQNEE